MRRGEAIRASSSPQGSYVPCGGRLSPPDILRLAHTCKPINWQLIRRSHDPTYHGTLVDSYPDFCVRVAIRYSVRCPVPAGIHWDERNYRI
eukprot:scaffold113645_cov45-Prasinocladus_malaysianus.AAC.1